MVIGRSAPRLARIAVAASIAATLAIALAAPASAQTRRVPGREGIEPREFQREGDAYRRVRPGMPPCVRGYEPGCIPDRRPGIPYGRIQPEPPPCIAGTPGAVGSWALQGTLLTPDKVISNGTIVIAGQKIAAVVAADGNIPTVRRGIAPPCPLELNAIILPGFIDLHNHLTWNILPRWHPFGKFGNRADWQGDPNSDPELKPDSEYEKKLSDPNRDVSYEANLGCIANLFAEVKAIMGGATAVVGSFSEDCVSGLIRNLDRKSGFPDNTGKATLKQKACIAIRPAGDEGKIDGLVVNQIFPLISPPDEKNRGWTEDRRNYLKCELATGGLKSILIHLAEGKRIDAASKAEFSALKATGLLLPGLAIIHGTALTAADFEEVQKSGAGLVWSPRSNVELYGQTANIPAAKQAGVMIAIAPDWSPTGSSGMLQELNYANAWFKYFGTKQLTAMATSIPAQLTRLSDRIGKLQSGLYADLLVIRRHQRSSYESVVTATPADIQLVVIGGRPIYGDSALMHKLLPGRPLQDIIVCGTAKALDLSGSGVSEDYKSWEEVKTDLQDRLNNHNLILAQTECFGKATAPPSASPYAPLPQTPLSVPAPQGLQ